MNTVNFESFDATTESARKSQTASMVLISVVAVVLSLTAACKVSAMQTNTEHALTSSSLLK